MLFCFLLVVAEPAICRRTVPRRRENERWLDSSHVTTSNPWRLNRPWRIEEFRFCHYVWLKARVQLRVAPLRLSEGCVRKMEALMPLVVVTSRALDPILASRINTLLYRGCSFSVKLVVNLGTVWIPRGAFAFCHFFIMRSSTIGLLFLISFYPVFIRSAFHRPTLRKCPKVPW